MEYNMDVNSMPFRSLTDYEVQNEFQSARACCLEKLTNNGFANFIRDQNHILDDHESPNTCKYYDIDTFNGTFVQTKGIISIFHMNVRRLAKHKGEFLAFLSTLTLSFDIIILTEIGNDANHHINEHFLPDFKCFYSLPKGNKYGGTAIFIKNSIGPVTLRPDLSIDSSCTCDKCNVEDSWVELQVNNEVYIIAGIYRHPNGNVNHFVSSLEKALTKIPEHANCVIAGDMNIDLINYNNPTCFEYFTTLSSFDYLPYIITPTRITDNTATIIDHIFIKMAKSNKNSIINSGNLFCDISDHLPNFAIIENMTPRNNKQKRPLIRIFSEKNIEAFREDLSNSKWEEIIANTDAELCYQDFYRHVCQLYEKNFPLVRLSRKRSKDKKMDHSRH